MNKKRTINTAIEFAFTVFGRTLIECVRNAVGRNQATRTSDHLEDLGKQMSLFRNVNQQIC